MNRRGFLQGILAAGVAPAFIGSSILMPVRRIVLLDELAWKPFLVGDPHIWLVKYEAMIREVAEQMSMPKAWFHQNGDFVSIR